MIDVREVEINQLNLNKIQHSVNSNSHEGFKYCPNGIQVIDFQKTLHF